MGGELVTQRGVGSRPPPFGRLFRAARSVTAGSSVLDEELREEPVAGPFDEVVAVMYGCGLVFGARLEKESPRRRPLVVEPAVNSRCSESGGCRMPVGGIRRRAGGAHLLEGAASVYLPSSLGPVGMLEKMHDGRDRSSRSTQQIFELVAAAAVCMFEVLMEEGSSRIF